MQSFHFWKPYKEILLVVDLMICKGLKRGHLFRGCIEELGVDEDDIFGGSGWGYLENISEIQFSELTGDAESILKILERSTWQVAPRDPWFAALEFEIAEERKAMHRPPSEGAD